MYFLARSVHIRSPANRDILGLNGAQTASSLKKHSGAGDVRTGYLSSTVQSVTRRVPELWGVPRRADNESLRHFSGRGSQAQRKHTSSQRGDHRSASLQVVKEAMRRWSDRERMGAHDRLKILLYPVFPRCG
jgi:hypothetical protein